MASTIRTDKIGPADGSADFTLPTADGTTGQFIKTNGSKVLSFATVTSAGFNSIQVFTAAGTWTRPTDITKVIVEVQGGGGGGGNHPSTEASSGGGGGGGYACKYIDVSSVTNSVLTVGAAGAAGSSGAGGNGGESKWLDTGHGGSSTVTGGGGTGSPYSTHSIGTGGSTSGGDFGMVGGNGYNQKARMGGGSQLGRGGQNLNHGEEGAKSPGTGYGGGGGGVTGALASTGSAGIIIVWEFK
tara:strand:- start:102 stop:827 length:726 start_codon:yes stop_codon:yes gene_type:complete